MNDDPENNLRNGNPNVVRLLKLGLMNSNKTMIAIAGHISLYSVLNVKPFLIGTKYGKLNDSIYLRV